MPKDWEIGLGVVGDEFFFDLTKISGLGDCFGYSLEDALTP